MNRLSGGLLALLGLAATLACSPAPNILPSNDLNRPTDLAFMCLGAFGTPGTDADGGAIETGPFQVSGRPMRACHKPPPATGEKQTPLAVSIHNRTFAFVPNSASGDLSVVDADKWKIIDLNKSTGGYGRVPLGTFPEQISASSDGCRLMSANRGSCNLSLVDPSTLLAGVFNAEYGEVTVPPGNGIQTVTPHWPDANSTPVGAAPYEAVFLPQDTQQLEGNNMLCQPSDTWRALVTFPSCSLVALLEMPSGTVQAWAKVTGTKVMGQDTLTFTTATSGAFPVCAEECGSGRKNIAGAGAASDAGTDPDAGTPLPTEPQPTSIAITPRAERAYVSFANVSAIGALALDSGTLKPGPKESIPLYEGAQGSNRIRLGVDPYPYTRTNGDQIVYDYAGRFVGDGKARAYLYVVARDGSLRIVDVASPGGEEECATNFDPLNNDPTTLPSGLLSPDTRCIPFNLVNRRQTSVPGLVNGRPASTDTPGLRFPTVPIDIAAADLSGPPVEDTVNGGYAWVLTASGAIYLVNIDPLQRRIRAVVHQGQTTLFDPNPPTSPPLAPDAPEFWPNKGFEYRSMPANLVAESPPFPNRPRDRNVMSFSQSLDPALGPPRVDLPPLGLPGGPYIEPLWAQGTEDNAVVLDANAKQTFVFFPDRDASIAQGWDVTWQGTLVSPRYSGILHGNQLQDGANFCSAGVLRGDIVTLLGCTNPAQCPTGMTCQRDPTLDMVEGGFTVSGLCLPTNQPQLVARCMKYVSSARRYEIVDARNSRLTLAPHLDEVVRSSVSECRIVAPKPTGTGGTTGAAGTTGTAGTMGTGGAAGTGGTGGKPPPDPADDCFDPTDGSTRDFQCVRYQDQPRCLQPCAKNEDCRGGRFCQLACTNVSQCPKGATACTNGVCFTGNPCDPQQSDPQQSCQSGQSCLLNPDKNDTAKPTICAFDQRSFCADGPPLEVSGCFPQLTVYHVSANASFMVTGAQAGNFSAGRASDCDAATDPKCADDGGTCRAFTAAERDPRLVSRIPLRPAPVAPGETPAPVECAALADPVTKPLFPTQQITSPTADGYYFDRFDPALQPAIGSDGKPLVEPFKDKTGTARPEAPQLVKWMNDWSKDVSAPNACIYLGGPLDSDRPHNADATTRMPRPRHARARFRNTQIAFLLANIDRAPASNSTIHFEVRGGFRQQAVNSLTTVEVSAPARLILGPIDSKSADAVISAAPYFFVVDQRRLGRAQGGGATRGQILRINPFGQPTAATSTSMGGYLPTYEDYTRSGGLFPIQ